MANYDLTPNIGLKNIKIGERPWGNEERENKDILDSYIGNLGSYGRTKISLLPSNKLNPSSPPVVSNFNGIDSLVFSGSTKVTWYVSQVDFSDYANVVRPFVITSKVSVALNSNVITATTTGYDFTIEVFKDDEIILGGLKYTVGSVSSNSLVLTSPVVTSAYTEVMLTVVPSIGGRLKLNILWSTSNSSDRIIWKVSASTLQIGKSPLDLLGAQTTIDPIVLVPENENCILQTTGFIKPEGDFGVSPSPVYFSLELDPQSVITDTINFLEANLQIAVPVSKPHFENTYYNVTIAESEPIDVVFTYTANGWISNSIETYIGGLTRTTNFTYDLEGNIVKDVSVFDTIEITNVYIYDAGNINIIGVHKTTRSLIGG